MLDTATPLVLSPADNVAIVTARAPQGARPLGLGVELAAPVMPASPASAAGKISRTPSSAATLASGVAAPSDSALSRAASGSRTSIAAPFSSTPPT